MFAKIFKRMPKSAQKTKAKQVLKDNAIQENGKDGSSRYQRALQEWNKRLGTASQQLNNWRLAALGSMALVILMLVALMMALNAEHSYVYVAKIKPGTHVAQLQPVSQYYQPSKAQKLAFVGRFVEDIMRLPLDPVLARQQWYHAYSVVEGRAVEQLTAFAREAQPLSGVGTLTRSVKITSAQPVSHDSYNLSWSQTEYKADGSIKKINRYNGVFTLLESGAPKTMEALMRNPLGLKIVYFSLRKQH